MLKEQAFQQVLTEANGNKIPNKKEKGKKSREAEVNVKK